MVKEFDYATKDSLQIRREGDNAKYFFFDERGTECLGVAIKHDVYKELETWILRCLKSKHLQISRHGWVSRHVGKDAWPEDQPLPYRNLKLQHQPHHSASSLTICGVAVN